MDNEILKDVQYKDKVFTVSNLGYILIKDGSRKRKLHKNSSGYLSYTEKKIYFLHRIVATAFCEKKEGKEFVNHIDGNKENNMASNLEWVTKSENELHSTRVLGNKRNILGLKENWLNPTHRRPVTIEKDGFTQNFVSGVEAAKFLNCSVSAVSMVLTGSNKTCKGFKINYL